MGILTLLCAKTRVVFNMYISSYHFEMQKELST